MKHILYSFLLIAFMTSLYGCASTRAVKISSTLPKVENVRVQNARVLLVKGAKKVAVAAKQKVEVYETQSQRKLGEASLGDEDFAVRGGKIALGNVELSANPIRLVPAAGDFLKVGKRRYRGQIELARDNDEGLNVINFVPLEEYLQGVVPNEMMSKSPLEALKAQAIASRTFALSRMNSGGSQAWDLEAGTNSQVYGGLDSEHPGSTEAVTSTRGIVASVQGRFVSAFYHSNCGGRTANVRDVWGSEASYLKGSACGYCGNSKHSQWTVEISKTELARRLRDHNVIDNDFSTIEISDRDASGRAVSMLIRGAAGDTTLKASAFRMMLGADKLKSTFFTVQDLGPNLRFEGKGWGHGVGLCQDGAIGMARAGYPFDEILNRYYPGVSLSRLE